MTQILEPADLARPSAFGDPASVYDLYARLRTQSPIVRANPDGYRPFWVMSRYKDIMDVETRPDVYLAGTRTVLLPEKVEAAYERKYGDSNGIRALTHMDGAYHRAHRSVTMDWFGPKNLRKFEVDLASIAKEFVDRMEDMGNSCDFALDVAYWYPLRVVLTLMGVPKEDEPMVLRMTQRLLSPADKSLKKGAGTDQAGEGKGDVLAEFAEYYHTLGARRRDDPRNDIVSTIANGLVDGAPMAYHEQTSYYAIASTAGHDTTAACTGGGMLGLMAHPEEMKKLKGDLGLLSSAANEFVRWTAPVKHFMRTPNVDVEWHGQTIPAGDAIMLCYASACRDEEIFADANAFRIDRSIAPQHLAFGYGPHYCLGKFLAVMEIKAFYNELLPRLKHIEPAGEPSFIESVFVSGPKNIPVHYRFG